jgi:hypothetical protein
MAKTLATVVGVLLSAALPACAVLDPQVHDARLFDAHYGRTPPTSAGNAAGQPEPLYSGDLAIAIDDANAQGRAYFVASAEYSQLRNAAPLAAAALGISSLLLSATNGGSSGVRIGLAGGSAAALGIEGFYDNRPRQLVYLSGAVAIACAVTAQRPLLMTESQRTALDADVAGLRKLLGLLAENLAAGTPRGPIPKYDPLQATKIQEAAVATLKEAVAFQKSIDTAGMVLREKVKEIVAVVDTQVVKTDPDPQAIQKVITTVGASVPKAPPAPAVTPKANAPKGEGVDWFDATIDAIIIATGLVRSDLEQAGSASDVDRAMASCKVPEIPGAIKIDPDETSHDVAKTPTTVVYSVRGGMLPISAGVSGEFPAGAFAINQSSTNGTIQVSVSVAKEAEGQSAVLKIGDASGATPHAVTIRVAAAAQSTTPKVIAPPTKVTPAPPAALTSALTPQRVAMIRRTLNVPTGNGAPAFTIDDVTALKAYADKKGITLDAKSVTNGKLPDALYKAIVEDARANAERLAPDATEQALLQQGLVDQVRSACKLTAVPAPGSVFDSALRDKVFDFEEQAQRNSASDPVIDGRLDNTRLTAMLKSNCSAGSS